MLSLPQPVHLSERSEETQFFGRCKVMSAETLRREGRL
jgi:hypothetical protein